MRRREKDLVRLVEAVEVRSQVTGLTIRTAWIGFVMAAGAIFVAAPILATSANELAIMTGLSATFIGANLGGGHHFLVGARHCIGGGALGRLRSRRR